MTNEEELEILIKDISRDPTKKKKISEINDSSTVNSDLNCEYYKEPDYDKCNECNRRDICNASMRWMELLCEGCDY